MFCVLLSGVDTAWLPEPQNSGPKSSRSDGIASTARAPGRLPVTSSGFSQTHAPTLRLWNSPCGHTLLLSAATCLHGCLNKSAHVRAGQRGNAIDLTEFGTGDQGCEAAHAMPD